LRGAGDRPADHPVLHYASAQHGAQQLQDALVADAFGDRLHQPRMRNRLETVGDFGLNHPTPPPPGLVDEDLQRVVRAGSSPLPWPSPWFARLGSPLPHHTAGMQAARQVSRHATDRPVASPNRAFDAGLRRRAFPPTPPACYRASWQLPGPDFHRQATASLRLMINPYIRSTSSLLGAPNSTHRRVNSSVPTCKQSPARIPSACADRNRRQVWLVRCGAGSMPARLRTSHAVEGPANSRVRPAHRECDGSPRSSSRRPAGAPAGRAPAGSTADPNAAVWSSGV
jgi:hypothetical protein